MDVTGSINVSVQANRNLSDADLLQPGSAAMNKAFQLAFPNGTDAGDIDLVYADSEILTTEASKVYNLFALVDPVTQAAIVFAKIRAIVIYSTLTANKVLTVGAGTTPFVWSLLAAAVKNIQPGGISVDTAPGAGWPVVNSSTNLLKILNAADGSSTFEIYIFGASA